MDLNITNAFLAPVVTSISEARPLQQPECPGYKFILESMEFSDSMETENRTTLVPVLLTGESSSQWNQVLLPPPAVSL